MRRMAWLLFLGCSSFLGGIVGVSLLHRDFPRAIAQSPSSIPVDPINQLGNRFEQVARDVSPTVVALLAVKPNTNPNAKKPTVDESGSGVMIKLPGKSGTYILTNNHVINRASASQITISLSDNRLFKPTQVWADPESDIALLLLDAKETFSTAILGDSDQVHVGQWVLALGSPFGLNQTVTHGIISARERGQIDLGRTIRIKDFLQTDAAINPGSSGGPLVNLRGEVIGINTAIASNTNTNSGVAFSVPINIARRVALQLLEKGSVTRGYLGLQTAESFEAVDAERLGMDRAHGALIERIYDNTPAAVAGLRVNDVILSVDGTLIRNENHFINMISNLPIGKEIRIEIWRNRSRQTVTARVGDWARAQSLLKPVTP